MYTVYSKSNAYFSGIKYFSNTYLCGAKLVDKPLHVSSANNFPQAAALKLPTNMIDINSSEMGRFSPQRERDLSGPVINAYHEKHPSFSGIDITLQADPHMNKYDCRGAVSLSCSMQSNVPSPFTGNSTHLNMPGSQWGQGHKYLSEHLHSAHYLTIRNAYRNKIFNNIVTGTRLLSTDTNPPTSAKEKLKKAVKEYGSTVVVFHVTISLLSLGGCYLLISSGVDLVDLLQRLNIGESLSKLVSSNAGTFVIAYAVHKLFAPVRMGITLTATPFIVRYLRSKGFLKKPDYGVGK